MTDSYYIDENGHASKFFDTSLFELNKKYIKAIVEKIKSELELDDYSKLLRNSPKYHRFYIRFYLDRHERFSIPITEALFICDNKRAPKSVEELNNYIKVISI